MKIICVHCKKSMELTDAMLEPYRAEEDKRIKNLRDEFEEEKNRAIGDTITRVMLQNKNDLAKSKKELDEQTTERDKENKDLKSKLSLASIAQAKALEKERVLEGRERELELEVQTKINEGLSLERSKIHSEIERENSLKMAEKDVKLKDVTSQLDKALKRLEQGSQQTQGEVFEEEIEVRLKAAYLRDSFTPVPKGISGGDLLQKVEKSAGSILWEFKRTKTWSYSWLQKLRADQLNAKVDLSIIVSMALPDNVKVFDYIEGVWVCSPEAYLALCCSLRLALLALKDARSSLDDAEGKANRLFSYMTGPKFRQKFGALLEATGNLREGLEKEKRAITKTWAQREEALQLLGSSMASLFGEMQANAGDSLPDQVLLSLEG